MDAPVFAFLAASGRIPRHVVQHWKREVWKPRNALLVLILLSAYLTPPTDDGTGQQNTGTVPQPTDHEDHEQSLSVAFALSIFLGVGFAGAAVPILQLFRLWLCRLIAAVMVHILESMPFVSRTQSLRLRALVWVFAIWLTCVAAMTTTDFVAGVVALVLEPVCRWTGIRLAAPLVPHSPEPSNLPFKLLVQLEALATMASAWSIVMRIEPFLSMRVAIPSPSHAPSLDRSAFFTSIKAFFAGPINARAAQRQQGRHRRLDRRRRQARAMGQQAFALPPDPGGVGRNAPSRPPQPDTVPAGPPVMPVPQVKPPREAGHTVELDLVWMSDVLLALINRALAAVQYAVVLASLPRVTFATFVAGLALHQQVSVVVDTWSEARGAAECLEFVLRRWAGPDEGEEQVCPMCFEPVVSHFDPWGPEMQVTEDELSFAHAARKGAARLDCGHMLHPTCLVAWLANQAFCPICHMPLQLAPPNLPLAAAPTGALSPSDVGFVQHLPDSGTGGTAALP